MDDRQAKLIAVYGFLGSGKTTVMLELARHIVARQQQAALVVNEAGDIPVDGKRLEVSGLPVKELFGGCICCAVVGDFIETLRRLGKEPRFRYILIEPSGMADAANLFGSIERHTDYKVLEVLILDAPRLPLLLKAAGPLIHQQLEAATMILLNKMDALSEENATKVRGLLRQWIAEASFFEISAVQKLPQKIINGILR